jgi:hypothetical protein
VMALHGRTCVPAACARWRSAARAFREVFYEIGANPLLIRQHFGAPT